MIEPGKHVGSYQILAELGAGGMGRVFRARDEKLRRDVAIKVLPDMFASDPERLARFQREAQLLAALNHPNIGVIHDLQEDGGARFLVLELVEGENLAERLKRGALSVDEALDIGAQIADALEAAHEKGIYHRDLKPANIQITPEGRVKVLDFGLAKMMGSGDDTSDISNSPTVSANTADGVILGTAAYMSPEQARGRQVDRQTDIWAFGCVLFEALTGQPAFPGETVTDILASIIKSDPDWTLLPFETPAAIRSLLRQCLQKHPRRRLHEIADARITIQDARAESPGQSEPDAVVAAPASPSWWRAAALAILIVIGFAGFAAGWLVTRGSPPPAGLFHFVISVAPAERLGSGGTSIRPTRTAIAVSPTSRRVVFSASAQGVSQLYSRDLADAEPSPIPGTEGASGPFFSPDGQSIGFWAGNKIRRVPMAGGAPVDVCAVAANSGLFGASWAEDNTIFFSDGAGIFRVPSGGGTPVAVTQPDPSGRERHLLPQALPGGEAILYTLVTSDDFTKAQVVAHRLDRDERQVLIDGAADARYSETGHLLYMQAGTLLAVPFDAAQLRQRGDPVTLAENVMQAMDPEESASNTGAGQFAAGPEALLYAMGGAASRSPLVSVDRETGIEQPLAAFPGGNYVTAFISRDGNSVAATLSPNPGANANPEVWVQDFPLGAPRRLASPGRGAVWSPDSKQLVYATPNGPYTINADGSGAAPVAGVGRVASTIPYSWAEGNLLVLGARGQGQRQGFTQGQGRGRGAPAAAAHREVQVLRMGAGETPAVFLADPNISFSHAALSPDGRWMAYVSGESGSSEVWVTPYPGPGAKHRISTEGGTMPVWTPDGRELLYRSDQRIFSVQIASLDPFRWEEEPRVVFETSDVLDNPVVRNWDANAERFLFVRSGAVADGPVTQIFGILNWRERLR